MRIGQLAKKTGIQVETIRYYEKEKLLSAPERDSSNYRRYSEKHIEELLFIKNCRAFDMSQQEIHHMRAIINDPRRRCDAIHQVVTDHIAHIDERIQELQSLKAQLKVVQEGCQHNHQAINCAIVEGMNSIKLVIPQKSSDSHVG